MRQDGVHGWRHEAIAKLDHRSVEQVYDALDDVEDERAIQRILAAISYNDGVTAAIDNSLDQLPVSCMSNYF
jgi:hypothetical protein